MKRLVQRCVWDGAGPKPSGPSKRGLLSTLVLSVVLWAPGPLGKRPLLRVSPISGKGLQFRKTIAGYHGSNFSKLTQKYPIEFPSTAQLLRSTISGREAQPTAVSFWGCMEKCRLGTFKGKRHEQDLFPQWQEILNLGV